MKPVSVRKLALAAALSAAFTVPAMAQEAGDWLFRIGGGYIATDTSKDDLIFEGSRLNDFEADVDDGASLIFNLTYFVSPNWGVELLAAAPFKHDIDGEGALTGLGKIGKAYHLPPTLSLQWYPRGGQTGWQPYVGLGVNYTYIFDEDIDPALSGALGSVLGAGSSRLDLDDSFGYAAQAGVDIPLNRNWMLNAGVWYLNIESTADVVTDVGTVSFDVDINPWVYNIGIAYRF